MLVKKLTLSPLDLQKYLKGDVTCFDALKNIWEFDVSKIVMDSDGSFTIRDNASKFTNSEFNKFVTRERVKPP